MKPWSAVEQRNEHVEKEPQVRVSDPSEHLYGPCEPSRGRLHWEQKAFRRHCLADAGGFWQKRVDRTQRKHWENSGYQLGLGVRGERERGNSDGGPIAKPLLTKRTSSDFVLQAMGNLVCF